MALLFIHALFFSHIQKIGITLRCVAAKIPNASTKRGVVRFMFFSFENQK